MQRIVAHEERISRRELERIGRILAERVAGRTLVGLRQCLEAERERLRGEADDFLRRAWMFGLGACESESGEDLVIATRLALLAQPEFSDPERIRGLFSALETNERLLELLRQIARADRGGRPRRALDVPRDRARRALAAGLRARGGGLRLVLRARGDGRARRDRAPAHGLRAGDPAGPLLLGARDPQAHGLRGPARPVVSRSRPGAAHRFDRPGRAPRGGSRSRTLQSRRTAYVERITADGWVGHS
jgi:hypothetical protein